MTTSCNADLTIENNLGLHARAAALFVQTASAFKADVFVRKGNREVNGKSIMGLLMLVATKGSKIQVRAEGNDARDAVGALAELLSGRFGETK